MADHTLCIESGLQIAISQDLHCYR